MTVVGLGKEKSMRKTEDHILLWMASAALLMLLFWSAYQEMDSQKEWLLDINVTIPNVVTRPT